MKKAIVIQVRMDSSRFPKKAIYPIFGKPLLWYVIERSKKINLPVIVATSSRKIDDPIVEITKSCGVEIFRGSFEDVLDRYYQVAKKFNLEQIFRVSADTPLIDPRLCTKMVQAFEDRTIDYIRFGYNTVGIGMEGFTFNALKTSWEKSKNPDDREHVTKFIKDHSDIFNTLVLETNYDLGKYHWTVETSYDFEFIKKIFIEFQNREIFFTEDILELLKRKPNLQKNE
jgi:spore coat polysaccharide biosynthesis protein SpsF (cytidylyltransferase family)